MDMTKYLIEYAKCDVNQEDTLNQTCLFYLSRDGREDLIRLLLRHGAKANHSDSYGQTPLFYAAREGHCSVMKMLIEAGADPDFIDNEGQTPIFYSVRMAKLQSMDFLIGNCDIDIHREDNYGNNIVHVAQKLKIDKVKKAQLIDRLVAEGLQVPNPAAEAKKKVSNIFILLEVLYLKFIKFS